MNGTTYKRRNAIVYDVTDEEPTFSEIVDILQTEAEETLFILRKLSTMQFHTHYHAFEVVPTSFTIILTHRDFCDYHPLQICKSFGANPLLLVPMKYHVLCVQ